MLLISASSRRLCFAGQRAMITAFIGTVATVGICDRRLRTLANTATLTAGVVYPYAVDVALAPTFNSQPDVATIATNPNRAAYIANLSPTSKVFPAPQGAFGDTTVPVSVTVGADLYWVLANDAVSKHASFYKFASGGKLIDSIDLGLVGGIKIDGGASEEDNSVTQPMPPDAGAVLFSTPGGVVAALTTGAGSGELLTFRGGNPHDPAPLQIVLEGEPRALSVFDMQVGSSAPTQFAWVAVTTPLGSKVVCYDLATSQKTTESFLGANLSVIDLATGIPLAQNLTTALHPNSTAFLHALVSQI